MKKFKSYKKITTFFFTIIPIMQIYASIPVVFIKATETNNKAKIYKFFGIVINKRYIICNQPTLQSIDAFTEGLKPENISEAEIGFLSVDVPLNNLNNATRTYKIEQWLDTENLKFIRPGRNALHTKRIYIIKLAEELENVKNIEFAPIESVKKVRDHELSILSLDYSQISSNTVNLHFLNNLKVNLTGLRKTNNTSINLVADLKMRKNIYCINTEKAIFNDHEDIKLGAYNKDQKLVLWPFFADHYYEFNNNINVQQKSTLYALKATYLRDIIEADKKADLELEKDKKIQQSKQVAEKPLNSITTRTITSANSSKLTKNQRKRVKRKSKADYFKRKQLEAQERLNHLTLEKEKESTLLNQIGLAIERFQQSWTITLKSCNPKQNQKIVYNTANLSYCNVHFKHPDSQNFKDFSIDLIVPFSSNSPIKYLSSLVNKFIVTPQNIENYYNNENALSDEEERLLTDMLNLGSKQESDTNHSIMWKDGTIITYKDSFSDNQIAELCDNTKVTRNINDKSVKFEFNDRLEIIVYPQGEFTIIKDDVIILNTEK